MPTFSKRSLKNLEGVHPDLRRVLDRAILDFDFTVIEGVRSPERQRQLYAQGRTKPGKKVTWTLTSNHFLNKRTGYGHAIDCVPHPLDWSDSASFDRMAVAILRAAMLENVAVRWGSNWDRDSQPREKGETDSPHFELAA